MKKSRISNTSYSAARFWIRIFGVSLDGSLYCFQFVKYCAVSTVETCRCKESRTPWNKCTAVRSPYIRGKLTYMTEFNVGSVSFSVIRPGRPIINRSLPRLHRRNRPWWYIFENNRARYISESNSICKLCDEEVEDIEHLLLSCPILNSTRLRYYSRLDHLTELLYNEPFSTLVSI
jgi:hypothetical protein